MKEGSITMINTKRIFMSILLLVPFLSASCTSFKQPYLSIREYTLEYDSPVFPHKTPLKGTIKIDGFSVAPAYDTGRIIYSRKKYEIDSYIYHRWSSNPGDMVTYLLGRDIRNSGLFGTVLLPGERMKNFSYRLGGTLEEFYEADGRSDWQGVLALSIILFSKGDAETGESVIFQKKYKVNEICEEKNPEALTEALSRAMKKVSEQVIEDLYSTLISEQ